MTTKTPVSTISGVRLGNRFLSVGEFVPTAALTACRLTEKQLFSNRLDHLRITKDAMASTARRALPLEAQLKRDLSPYIVGLNREIARYEHAAEFDLPTIDPSFLSWKTRAGFPAFSIFNLECETTTLKFVKHGVNGGPALTAYPAIPKIMAEHYLDQNLKDSLRNYCDAKRFTQVELAAQYRGVMPDCVRETIVGYLEAPLGMPRFEQILIVADAPHDSWKIKGIPEKDPLVIGIAYGVLWLIAAYDLTPVEKFAHDLCVNSKAKVLSRNSN
ncbi:MAG: hypothetical protein JWO73_652 [Candidatus Taylorbacteria bacterium]|nr:hypothetical protein [Candidatus Taylorbacteria bacterium]